MSVTFSQRFRGRDHNNPNGLPSKPFRLAIVGCGPRGLQCLEALSRTWSDDDLLDLQITIYESAEDPGAGENYDASQPHTMRMNVTNGRTDFPRTGRRNVDSSDGTLIGWLSHRYPELAASDCYIPRAVVREYLSDRFQTVRRRLARSGWFNVRRTNVEQISVTPDGVVIRDSNADIKKFDHAVLVIGNDGAKTRDQPSDSASDNSPHESFVFPLESSMSGEKILAGGDLTIRGFGLTSIDAILMLTEGRGGRFLTGNRLLPKYQRSDEEPRHIEVYCRSGRPMSATPTESVEPVSDDFWESYRERLDKLQDKHGNLLFRKDLWCIMTKAAAELLNRSGSQTSARNVNQWYRDWSRYKMNGIDSYKAMLQSYAVATAARPIDIPFALGECWRKLHPNLAPLVSYEGLRDDQWNHFHSVRREMKRLAFGPPAATISKLISLIRQGTLTMRCHGSRRPSTQQQAATNAKIASSHDIQTTRPLSGLIDEGLVDIDPVTRAVKVRWDGMVSSAAGRLSIFGNCTEGWVLENNTPSRTFPTRLEVWSRTLASQLDARHAV